MTAKLSKNFHGVGIGPLSKILAVNGIVALDTHFYIFNISQIHKESITCVQKYPALHWAFLQIRKENHQTSCIKNSFKLHNIFVATYGIWKSSKTTWFIKWDTFTSIIYLGPTKSSKGFFLGLRKCFCLQNICDMNIFLLVIVTFGPGVEVT